MTTLNIDSSARLIHEAIQQLGWSADPTSLIDRVKRLDIGLPAEDEFVFILSWLGKCSLVHKLDQSLFPPKSRETFQVPDLLASFVTNSGRKLALIEVKVTNKEKLRWKAEYFERLKNYSSLIGFPLLVAWKFHGLWLLVDIDCFIKARTNFHLSVKTAMKNSLMSYLAGDFAYVMKPNVGLHFVMQKERVLSEKEANDTSREEIWLLRVENAFFTDSEGREASELPTGLWPLFISADPEARDRVDKDRAYQSFVIPENQGMKFAHAALPVLINFSIGMDNKLHWRKQLEEHKYPVDINIFHEAAREGIKKGYMKCVFYMKPAEIPRFLEDMEITEQSHYV